MGPEHRRPEAGVSGAFTAAEERAVIRALAADGAASCPRCGAPLDRHEVPPREGVPYVRHRIQVVCTGCRAGVAVDRRAVERERDT